MPSPPSGKRWPKYWSALRNSRSASTCPGVRAGESRGGSDGGGADGLILAGGAGAGALSAAVSGKETEVLLQPSTTGGADESPWCRPKGPFPDTLTSKDSETSRSERRREREAAISGK